MVNTSSKQTNARENITSLADANDMTVNVPANTAYLSEKHQNTDCSWLRRCRQGSLEMSHTAERNSCTGQ